MYRYVYCITGASRKPRKAVIGLENSVVYTMRYEEIAAVVSEVAMAKIPVSHEGALRHAAVISAIQREQTTLPMRFSSVFHDDSAVLGFLRSRYAVFVSDLARLRDKVEMGLRVIAKDNKFESMQSHWDRGIPAGGQETETPPPGACAPASSGTAYLQQRRAYYESQDKNDSWAQEMVKTCHAQFEGVCISHAMDTNKSSSQGISLNYLIHKDSLARFKERLNDLVLSLTEFQFLCSGPWPPYHFVSTGEGA